MNEKNIKNKEEKRKYERFRAKEGAYAAISPASHKLGQIVNISMGGLVFKYIDNAPPQEEEASDPRNEMISLGSSGQFVDSLPFKTIEEKEFSDPSSFSFLKMKLKRIEFKELTFDQIFQIENFIRKNMVNNPKGAEIIISVDE